MFNLEKSIAEWRRQMLAAGIKTPVPLVELEIHLREDMEQQKKSGLNDQEAFDSAVQKIGQAYMIQNEFEKQASKPIKWVIYLFCSLSLCGSMVAFVSGLLLTHSHDHDAFLKTCGRLILGFSLLGMIATGVQVAAICFAARKSQR